MQAPASKAGHVVAMDGASRLIEEARKGDEFHLSKAIWLFTGDYVPTRINGESNPAYHEALRAVQNVLATYAAHNNFEVMVRRDGRHNILQLREKVTSD